MVKEQMKNKIRERALDLIDNCQRGTDKTSNGKDDMIYGMAYNDGVLHLMKVLLKDLEDGESKDNE